MSLAIRVISNNFSLVQCDLGLSFDDSFELIAEYFRDMESFVCRHRRHRRREQGGGGRQLVCALQVRKGKPQTCDVKHIVTS